MRSKLIDNTLYYGVNLDILRKHVKGESVDLIYLNPPFNSKASHNILFNEVITVRQQEFYFYK